jgi:hypothetical protein
MKKLVFLALLVFPALMFAQSAFDGTWKTDMSKSKLSQKPYTFTVDKGTYKCESCAPPIEVKADGQDQAVSGQVFDTISVKAMDQDNIRVVTKKGGKTASDATRSASDGGNTLTVSSTNYPADGSQSVKAESKWARVSKGPAGSNNTSGSWRIQNVSEDAAGLTATWKVSGDEVTMSTPDGMNWTAKAGGGDAPVKGVYANETVSVKTMGPRKMEVTYKRDGKLYVVDKMTVSPDGKTISTVSENMWTKRTSTMVDEKQ